MIYIVVDDYGRQTRYGPYDTMRRRKRRWRSSSPSASPPRSSRWKRRTRWSTLRHTAQPLGERVEGAAPTRMISRLMSRPDGVRQKPTSAMGLLPREGARQRAGHERLIRRFAFSPRGMPSTASTPWAGTVPATATVSQSTTAEAEIFSEQACPIEGPRAAQLLTDVCQSAACRPATIRREVVVRLDVLGKSQLIRAAQRDAVDNAEAAAPPARRLRPARKALSVGELAAEVGAGPALMAGSKGTRTCHPARSMGVPPKVNSNGRLRASRVF